MRKLLIMSALSLLMASPARTLMAQGCSDAGFCTAPVMNGTATDTSTSVNSIGLGFSYGLADNDITVLSGALVYSRKLGVKNIISARIGLEQHDGDLATTTGLSDIFLTYQRSISEKIDITGGIKIPISDGNVKENGAPLPMDYQPGLGTFDLLVGAGYHMNNFGATVGFQIPLTQNKNQFDNTIYPEGSTPRDYFTTNEFVRAPDGLVRIYYNLLAHSPSWSLQPSLLSIFHLTDDKYTDSSGKDQSIDGSAGLTLNGNLKLTYSTGVHAVELGVAAPFVVRDNRPDGLTRSLVVGLEYTYKF